MFWQATRRHSVARSKLLRVEPTPGPPLSLRAAASRRAPTPQPHNGSWRGCYDARTGMPLGIPRGAMCVQRFDDSLNSAIHITYRISLRSSSMPEPRDPLLKVLSIFIIKLRRHRQHEFFGWVFGGRAPVETGGRPTRVQADSDDAARPAKATRYKSTRVGGSAQHAADATTEPRTL